MSAFGSGLSGMSADSDGYGGKEAEFRFLRPENVQDPRSRSELNGEQLLVDLR